MATFSPIKDQLNNMNSLTETKDASAQKLNEIGQRISHLMSRLKIKPQEQNLIYEQSKEYPAALIKDMIYDVQTRCEELMIKANKSSNDGSRSPRFRTPKMFSNDGDTTADDLTRYRDNSGDRSTSLDLKQGLLDEREKRLTLQEQM